MKKPTIDIYTIQHKGIIGGGKWRFLKSFPQGVRGAFQAEKFRREEHQDNIRCYGNVGCGKTAAFVEELEVTQVLRDEYETAIDMGYKTIALDGDVLPEKQRAFNRIQFEIDQEREREWQEYLNSR